jgi:hypothetical protein
MFVINDMEMLSRLGKFKILESILPECSISISAVRLSEYSFMVRKQIEQHLAISIIQTKEDFHEWCIKRPGNLSVGDISSIYLSFINKQSSLVLSGEDIFLKAVATEKKVICIQFDDFVLKILKDDKMIELYKLIKAA